MKVCPFISHMLGEDRAEVLQIGDFKSESKAAKKASTKEDDAKDVVILGYDGESAVGVAQKPAKARKTTPAGSSHLLCLKESCRFFQKTNGDCKFDSVLNIVHDHTSKMDTIEQHVKKIDDMEKLVGKNNAADQILDKIDSMKDQLKKINVAKSDKDAEKTVAKVNKDLDKFWKFQTKSVSELISSIGETDKKQEKLLTTFKKELNESINSQKPDKDNGAILEVKEEVDKLRSSVDLREESIESFSTTVSELVMNIDDTLKQLEEKNNTLVERIDGFDSSLPRIESFQEKLDEIKNNITETVAEKMRDVEAPDLSKDVETLGKRFDEIMDAHKDAEERLGKWCESIESRLNDIHANQDSWKAPLDRIEEKQSEVTELVKQERDRITNESTGFNKKEAKKYNNLGVTSFHNGELELAREQFNEAVTLDPRFAESWNNLGLVYTELKNDEEATKAFSKAVEINPDLPAAYNNLGYIFYKQGSYDQAIEMYNEALGRSTDSSSAYTNLGNAHFKQGNREDAKKAWGKALDIDPDNEKASRSLKKLEND